MKLHPCFRFAIGAALTGVLGMDISHLQATPVVDTPPHNVLHRSYPGSAEWVTWAWTGDNNRYIFAEREVFHRYESAAKQNPKAGPYPRSVMDQYRAAAWRNTSDPMAVFKFAYADLIREPQEGFVDGDALTMLQGIDPGSIREYAHARYCLTLLSEPNKNHDSINAIAVRLMKTDPSDSLLRELYIYNLCMVPADIPTALKLAHEDVERQPLVAHPHSVLGYVYENEFLGSNRVADRDNAVREYKRYLALAPSGDEFRMHATYLIGLLMKMKVSR